MATKFKPFQKLVKKAPESEFGKGFIYNLILFAKHFERMREYEENAKQINKQMPNNIIGSESHTIEMWFNGAGDHFFEFEIPTQFIKTPIGKLAKDIQERALNYRSLYNSKRKLKSKDFEKIFADIQKLGRMIDKELGLKPIKATWD